VTSTELVAALNAAWPRGDYEQVAACYHPDALLWPPDGAAPIVGREAILATYREFAASAHLENFASSSIETWPVGGQSVVHMEFRVDYTLAGERYVETGLEIYWVDPTPLILWRHQTIRTTRTY
jgi:uncharacterized protein (TIGR02246 family)